MIRGLSALALAAASLTGATVPRPAAEFVIHGPGGQALLSQYRGKVVLLSFIQTTCPHCQNSVQTLSAIQKEYGPRGFQALAVAFNDLAPQLVPSFVEKFRPAFPVGYTNREKVYDYLQFSSASRFSVPIFLFIDKKGTIRAQYTGEEAFFKDEDKKTRAMVETLLKEPVPKGLKKSR